MTELKKQILAAVEAHRDGLLHLSHAVHDHPELADQEYFAAEQTREYLASCGYDLRLGVGGLDTAFMVTKEGLPGGPHIAFLAEYDALPGLGHGCGHNVILTTAVGAFLAMAELMAQLPGKVSLIGTPGEEKTGRKVTLLEQHVFDDVDFALMMHPSTGHNLSHRGGRACTDVDVQFYGKSAHSSVPADGINALSAVIATFNAIDHMRPIFALNDNVNGVIYDGGKASNVIPDYAHAGFTVRAKTLFELEALVEHVKKAIETAAVMTGARPEVRIGTMYAERYCNLPMCEAFVSNMAELGEEVPFAKPGEGAGSSDIGNVSIKIPAIHEYLYIAPAGVNGHSLELAEAAASPRADEVCVKGAQGLAMTGLDLLTDAALRERAHSVHEAEVPAVYKGKY